MARDQSIDVHDEATTAAWDEPPDTRDIDWSAQLANMDYDPADIEPPPPPGLSIYRLATQPGWVVKVEPPNPAWPAQFETIKAHIHDLLANESPPVPHLTIEHVGSTAVPGLHAKPNIDVIVTFRNQETLEAALEAFAWEMPSRPPYVGYTRIPAGGGVQGRESLKLHVPWSSPYIRTTPTRSLYLINDSDANPAGQVQIRCYRTLRNTLLDPKNADLLKDYAEVKLQLASRILPEASTYPNAKDGIIRRILVRGGWTDEEVDHKESLSKDVYAVADDEPPY